MDLVAYYDAYWRQADDTFDMERLGLLARLVSPGEQVLEVDCGPGVLANLMRERGAVVQGTDLSAVAVERTRAKGIPCLQVDLDVQPLPFADGTFDTVVSNSAMEHRFFHERSLSECARVLKPGGKFILCLPNIAHWICRLWVLRGRFPYVKNSPTDLMHIRFFTVHEAWLLCESHGLTVLRVDGSASMWAQEFYPPVLRHRRVRGLYARLAGIWPSLFARDFVLLCRKR